MDTVTQLHVNSVVAHLFELQFLTKINHFNTESFARHKATDEFYVKITNHIDRFVEVLIGRYNIKPLINNINVDNKYLSDTGIVEYFKISRNILTKLDKIFKDTSLLTIRDEIIADINNTLYLFNLK